MVMMRCPDPAEWLLYSLEQPTAIGQEDAARHLRECALCHAEIARVRATVSELHAAAGTSRAFGPCLDEVALAALAEAAASGRWRRLAGDEWRSRVAHLADCDRCRRELGGLCRVMADERVVEESSRLSRRTPIRRWRTGGIIGVGVAAAFTVMTLGGRENPAPNGEARFRDETVVAIAPPRTLTPNGTVGDAPVLRWTRVAQTDGYTATIFDAEGRVVWQTETTDTAVTVPESVRLPREVRLLWRVEARAGFDRSVSSVLTPFVISAAVTPP